MIPSLCIADRVPASACPCPQCRKVIAMANSMGQSMRRRLVTILLESLVSAEASKGVRSEADLAGAEE